jgi:enoyl-CoA hydratase/carnithine racemase
MCCDFRIASEDALGLPRWVWAISHLRRHTGLPRHVPPGVAMQMILTGDPIDAQTAYRYGLVLRVVSASACTRRRKRSHLNTGVASGSGSPGEASGGRGRDAAGRGVALEARLAATAWAVRSMK